MEFTKSVHEVKSDDAQLCSARASFLFADKSTISATLNIARKYLL
jgi:hypothetical protein